MTVACRRVSSASTESGRGKADVAEVMWYTADIADNIRKAAAYGFGDDEMASKMVDQFNWTKLKHKRDAYIKRLNGI